LAWNVCLESGERTENATRAVEQYVEDLQALIPTVVRQHEKAQATYNSAFDARTTVKSESVKAEDWVY